MTPLVMALLRSRWGWLILGAAVLGLGVVVRSGATPQQSTTVSGVVSATREVRFIDGYQHDELTLAGDAHTYKLNRYEFHPALTTVPGPGHQVTLWVPQHQPDQVVALEVASASGSGTTRYTTTAYDDPEGQARNAVIAGWALIGLGALMLVIGLIWSLLPWGKPARARYVPLHVRMGQGDATPWQDGPPR